MLKRRIIFVASLLLFLLIASQSIVSASNLSMTVTQITASSYQGGYEPPKASDQIYNSSSNGWRANAAPSSSNPQWIKYDLGSVKYAGAIEIYPEPGYGPKTFTIQTSLDDVTYTTQKTISLTADKRTYNDWPSSKARYIKINVTSGFNSASQIREAYIFSEILPHRVSTLSGGDLFDFSRLTEAGFNALHRANIQLVNPIICGYAPDFKVQVLPNGGDPDVDANYDWSYADEMVNRFTSHGIDMFIGQCLGKLDSYWPQLIAPMVDENGNQFQDAVKVNPFVSDSLTLTKTFNKKVAEHFSDNPFVRLQAITGPGYFGGIEIFGGDIVNPTLFAYDDQAKARFREWLQTKYANVAALNTAWGTSYSAWNEVQPPKPQRTGMTGALDVRQSWSDMMFWLRDFVSQYTVDTTAAVRSVSDKPLYAVVDGGQWFSPMEGQASIGLTARILRNYKPFVLASSGGDEVFGPAAIAAAARFYGYDTANDNANYESRKLSDDTMFSLLAKGIGTFNNSNMAEDFIGDGWTGTPHTTGWDPSATYAGTEEFNQYAQRSGRLLAVDPLPEQGDVAIYNSFYSSNYRKGYRYDDYMNIYDRDHGLGFNVRPFASWSHYLDTPDIVDDFLIEDGALANYKVLVSANSSLTLTSDTAQTNVLNWVSGGKAIVGFGKDSFNYKLNLASRSISGSTNVSNWMMGISGGSAAATTTSRTASVAANKPSWLTSLKAGETATFAVADNSQAQVFTSLLSGAVPVLVDGNGNTIMAEYSYGSGKVLFSTIPVSDSEMFHDGFMGKILSDFADHAGVVRKVKVDGDRYHAAYMGTNKQNGNKVIVVADPQYMANGQFLPSGTGYDPQYVSNGQTLAIETDSSLNGLPVEVDVTAPWRNISGGTIQESSVDLPQKRITYTASSSQPLLLQALPYGSLPIVKVTAGMSEKPFLPKNVADSSKDDAGMWKGGRATPGNPQTVTVDFGAVYPVSGMELYPFADDDQNELFSFETGTYAGWTASGTAFGAAPNPGTHNGAVTGMKGRFWADSQWGGEAATGSLKSMKFMIDKEVLSIRIAGYDGVNGTNNQNLLHVKRFSDNAIIYTVKPPQSNAFATKRLEMASYIGTEVYLQVEDNCTASAYCWLGIDYLSLSSYKEQKEIADFSFEQGTFSGWTASGTAFSAAPTASDHGGQVKGWLGSYWADSRAGGETATGTLTSAPFLPQSELLSFRIAGYDGSAGTSNLNAVYLKKASDNSVLFTVKPPQSDNFKDVTWDVTPYRGTSVYLQVVDGHSGSSSAWLGIDDVSFSSNYGFERGTFSGWTVNGTGFGTAPSYQKTDHPNLPWAHQVLSVPGYDGKYYATTHIAGNHATGSLTSKNFVIQKPVLSFRGAGYDGPNGTSNQNYYWLMRASDNTPLIVGKPPQAKHFVQTYWDVSAYIGTEVYIKVEDYSTDPNSGWIAFDDLVQLNNFDFEVGTWTGWTRTGTAFGTTPSTVGHGNLAGWRGKYLADSFAGGESATGTIRSKDFILESKTFSFRKAGWDGAAGTSNLNFYTLKRASDGAVLFNAKPPQSDGFVTETWDVSAYVGTKVYFEVVDTHTASNFAWLAVDDINWRGSGPRSFTVQASADNVNWGSPLLTVTNQGNKYDSYNWTPANARYVKLTITDGYGSNVSIKEMTFKKDLVPLSVSAVTASSQAAGYEASKAIDGITESDTNIWANIGAPPSWIQFDLGSVQSIRAVEVFARNNTLAQKLGPKDFNILVSADGTTWTNVYTARSNGENEALYTFPAVNARYVKLDIATGWNNTSQIREVKIFQ
ncbi:discoidin domain-containing protein [Paenibacillus nasutitermitis]|uniref:F5/8 type C domain-containing protein n=1 Tax=Paenibacillus nasutitermitis TaxID=1652958 RepID=A0A916YSZ5_9BACL|nr:discoidin domain-containing protein [Paenibacillus nasutitermitis]GGD59185.1 hypothetical protein GCM10010911_16250 [Paenibacillus nasutitermitis]